MKYAAYCVHCGAGFPDVNSRDAHQFVAHIMPEHEAERKRNEILQELVDWYCPGHDWRKDPTWVLMSDKELKRRYAIMQKAKAYRGIS